MARSFPVYFVDSLHPPVVREISADQPWQWVKAGWKDTMATPVASIVYGALFVLMGYFLINAMAQGAIHMVLAWSCGFLLLGPFLAIGLYDMSRLREKGENPTLVHALTAWRNNPLTIFMLALVIGFITLAWVRMSSVVFSVVLGGYDVVGWETFTERLLNMDGLTFLLFYFGVGAFFACVVFAISVVSIPMLMDRNTDIITAVATSVTAVRHNLGPMLNWAALIVIFTAVGLATFYVGLAITMPIIGHATWHAYRAVVEPEGTPPRRTA